MYSVNKSGGSMLNLLIFFLAGSLAIVPPAFAVSYSGSALLDFRSLTFGGINVSPIHSGFLTQFQGTVVDPIGNPGDPQGSRSLFENNSWTSHTLIDHFSQVGTAVSSADANFLFASSNIIGLGFVGASTIRSSTFSVNGPGYLTASIQYAFSQGGVIETTAEPHLFGGQSAFLEFLGNNHSGVFSNLLTTASVLGDGSKAGTLSLSQWFNEGDSATLRLTVNSLSMRTIPVPDMFWPTLAAFFSIAVACRRRQKV
jgi:hypothetical protein